MSDNKISMRDDFNDLGSYFFRRLGILLLFAAAIGAAALTSPLWATDEEGARKTLENAGFQPTKVGGYSWLACGKGDLWHTKFTAKNVYGKEVSGTVCKGIFKGSTIRFD